MNEQVKKITLAVYLQMVVPRFDWSHLLSILVLQLKESH